MNQKQRHYINVFRDTIRHMVGTDFESVEIQASWNKLNEEEHCILLRIWEIEDPQKAYLPNIDYYNNKIKKLFEDKDYIYYFLTTPNLEKADYHSYYLKKQNDNIDTFFAKWMKLNDFHSRYECERLEREYYSLDDSRVISYWHRLRKSEKKKILKQWQVSNYTEAISLFQ